MLRDATAFTLSSLRSKTHQCFAQRRPHNIIAALATLIMHNAPCTASASWE